MSTEMDPPPGWEDRAVERFQREVLILSGVDPAIQAQLRRLVEAIRSDRADGNCPACESSGVPVERMRRESPRYMAAVDAADRFPDADRKPTPDHPRSWCWTCRSLLAAGFDPVALATADAVDYRAAQRR